MASGQGQQLKSAHLSALNAQKQEVITDGQTDRRTDGPTVTYRVACTRLKTKVETHTDVAVLVAVEIYG